MPPKWFQWFVICTTPTTWLSSSCSFFDRLEIWLSLMHAPSWSCQTPPSCSGRGWWVSPFALAPLVPLLVYPNSPWTTPKFFSTSSKSCCSNRIFTTDHYSSICCFYAISVRSSFCSSHHFTFPLAKTNNFFVRATNYSITLWFACFCSKTFLNLTHFELMVPNVLQF